MGWGVGGGGGRAIASQTNTDTVSKATLGERLRDRVDGTILRAFPSA